MQTVVATVFLANIAGNYRPAEKYKIEHNLLIASKSGVLLTYELWNGDHESRERFS